MSESAISALVVVVIVNLATSVAAIVSNVYRMRRTPPVAEELYRDFATKAELAHLRTEFLSTFGELFAVTRTLRDKISESTASLTGQINRLEGILSRCPGPEVCANPRTRPHP